MIEVLRRVADSSLQQSAASNRLADRVDKLVPAFEQIRRDLYDVKADREMDQSKIDLAISKISTDLALVLDNVKHAQDDVRDLQRDVTGSFVIPKEEKKNKVVETIEAFERLSVPTKILIAILVLIAGASGWLTHWLSG